MEAFRIPQGKPKVIAIVGPTASGKSSLGLRIAKQFKGEIISADSRQIYKGMEVISRAPSKKEKVAVPHYMVSIADPKKTYSAGAYTKAAQVHITSILKKKKLPVVVGGTGFYADALLRGLTLPEVPPNKKLRAQLGAKTPKQLLAQLKKLDPESAKRVDPKNIVRIIRAIEIASAIGTVPTLTRNSMYEVLWIGISPKTKVHEKNILKGVEARLKEGMVAEAKKLRSSLTKKRYMELGFEFAYLVDYIDKKITKKELLDAMANGERKYSIRQIRWFKREKDIHWISNEKEALKIVQNFL